MKPIELVRDPATIRRGAAVLFSVALWLAEVILAILSVFALRELLIWALALLIPQPDTLHRLQAAQIINLAQECGTVVFGVIGLMLVVFSTERVFREAGQPRLIRTLIRMIVVEAVLVLPVAWFFWR